MLLTLAPLGALLFSSLGLYLGSAFQARNVMALFATPADPVPLSGLHAVSVERTRPTCAGCNSSR
ncbi:hypothetical protein ACU686_08475 [Yinghuangia aomiensis]